MEPRKIHVLGVEPEAVERWLREHGEPAFRCRQVLEWVYRKWADSFASMTNLPKELRESLSEAFEVGHPKVVAQQVSRDGQTEKFLFELADGERIESVAMQDGARVTFCVSSQAGCALGCRFCATGAAGFARDLAVHEILGQVAAMARAKGVLGNVVFMGMGEPLLNLGAVEKALAALHDPRRFGLGARRVTVSTAGVTPGIRRLAASPVRPHLALSLNSPFDEQRSELMPVNRRYTLRTVLEACRQYSNRSGRRLFLEYVLLSGVNTSTDAAHAVARMALELHAAVNLIPYNAVAGCAFRSPTRRETERFRDVLRRRGVTVTERFRRGRDIQAACGQLRGEHVRTR